MTIEINKKTLDKLNKRIAEASKKLKDSEKAFKKASILLDQWVQQNFDSEGGKVGGWKPFSPITLKMLENTRRGSSAKLLKNTGLLRASFVPSNTDKQAKIRNEVPYGVKHDKGIGVPQRRILPMREEILPVVRPVLKEFIKDAIK